MSDQILLAEFTAALQQAAAFSSSGRIIEAAAAFDRAAAIIPGHAAPFTFKSTMLFRHAFGWPGAPRLCEPARRPVSMRSLGLNGKFGNQLLQYGFLRAFAKRHGFCAEVPDWIGRDLFDLDDPLPGDTLPHVDESETDLFAGLKDDAGAVFGGHDLGGYFCRHTSLWGDSGPEDFRALYQPGEKIRTLMQVAIERLAGMGDTLVAVHIRRGDFGHGPFWIAPSDWYLAWLEEIWECLPNPLLYVASDDSHIIREFARFKPINSRDLNIAVPGAEFYLDHHVLSQAKLLATSNSTFSFTAAMLNRNASAFLRPDIKSQKLVNFEPWNSEVLLSR